MNHASSSNKNSVIDSPTRNASARAMRWSRPAGLSPLRSMNTPALASAPSTITKAITITIFMARDYRRRAWQR